MDAVEQEPDDNPYVRDPDTDFEPVDSLAARDAREQAALLRAAIRYHDYRYYVEADPVIDDRTYDALFSRLLALEETFDLDSEGSPTQRVGGGMLDELETVEHVASMRSLDHSGEADDVREFDQRVRRGLADAAWDGTIEYFCDPKFDGVSIEIVYEDGIYERAATRGDGARGDDVTEQVRTIPAVPDKLRGDYPEFLAVRGEVLMPREAFQAYNRDRIERGDDPFANPRNATAGTLRQLDPTVVAERPLTVFFFSVLDSTASFDRYSEIYERFPEWGLRVTDHTELADDIEEALAYRDRMLDRREQLDYEIDGVVLTLDDREACELLGATSRAPRWAFAYKFPARSDRTTVRDIVVQVGRTGRLTPVALLDPVEVGGVTVSRASLHNPAEIARLGVSVGDEVVVERAGDVIPDVTDVLDGDDEHFAFPKTCPACGAEIERDGPLAFCPAGLSCPAQREQAIAHYVSRSALDIEGLGEKRIEQLVDAGLLAEPADLYDLSVDDLTDLEGWGEQSARNLLEEIDATRTPALADFLTGLGIHDVGETTARELARHFGSFEAIRGADDTALQDVPDIGPNVAASIRHFFDTEDTAAAIDRLLAEVSPQDAETNTDDALDGTTFVFTGSLEGLTRSEATEIVERHGGNATSSVSGNTDYLVVGDDPGQTKRADADREGVSAITDSAFRELLAAHGIDLP